MYICSIACCGPCSVRIKCYILSDNTSSAYHLNGCWFEKLWQATNVDWCNDADIVDFCINDGILVINPQLDAIQIFHDSQLQ